MILIVDDEAENIFTLKELLESKNFQVDSASSGQEALKKILDNNYELVILNAQIPDMDGFEVAESIRGFSKTRDLPIIFLSAVNQDIGFIKKGYESGAIDYLVKPIDPDILLLKVKTFHKLYDQTHRLNKIQAELLKEIEIRKITESKKDEFLSIASHELKTPLTSIKGYLQLLERTINNDDKELSETYVKRSQVQLGKLQTLIEDLLNISKIESGKLKLSKVLFSLKTLLTEALELIRHTHNSFKVEVTSDIDDLEIFADPFRIEQVLVNYLFNAIKYSEKGSIIKVRVVLLGENSLRIEVLDQGIGIAEKDQEHLFEKFYRVNQQVYRSQGLGIGLYICSEIIKQHNGRVGVNSVLGKGSTFYFTIPIQEADKKLKEK